jgi:hypothetical protein
MLDYYEFEKRLRNLANCTSLCKQDIINEILNIADEYLMRAEELETKLLEDNTQ